MSINALALAIVLQAPGDGWAFVHDTGKVKTLYWELFDTTVTFRLTPEDQRLLADFAEAVGLRREPR